MNRIYSSFSQEEKEELIESFLFKQEQIKDLAIRFNCSISMVSKIIKLELKRRKDEQANRTKVRI